ncbi:hypothetical protein A2276_05480 [candidate division WOR-1 bacterium RIFOXYA12_FULL_43_27]|uniref:Uncharacterized protein n=1 Tax=candidate division WOR-1 bacterium RIFOXYC2_FULL_46_14 TaxID=1802587 RepID=A0A1F4U3N2_UNCSA|nr:MAG: hypothetical protein A2276_05480 [candidate division WOR-1 bacterium RIFOXYA12_FULL_43_27]OGC20117.1 MAG: hypothetical protein A2292_03485 [candidate division WOR-1 bacterium RIFOXYB2_FULL_46_45]OGC32146.1 MAG: hypothetical protein A2232_07965 [candidate division WOR-1 bacterium RIFOXYA2_FULL_46_56]OGC39546.1 MAG: hypothetical protein A2438_08330 [candidate division WOR-1 bacterium RIFOXYC2_FULL_46_14]
MRLIKLINYSIFALFLFCAISAANDGIEKWQIQQNLLVSPPLYLEAADNDTIEIKFKSPLNQTVRILWVGTFDNNLIPQKQVEFEAKEKKAYVINLKHRNPLWDGTISRIILTPVLPIDSIKIKKGTLGDNLSSGIFEFFGPKGRAVVGSTINNIPASSFCGRSVNHYAYWIIFIAAIALTLLSLSRREREAGTKIVWTVIVLWILLETNAWYNQINILKSDWPLWGKTLDEKRAEVTGADFYNFLKFCDQKLPPGSKIQFETSAGYFHSKATYYLYPHRMVTKEADYCLVYREPAKAKGTIFAKYKEGEYILKCK